ncbi:hypothetical protein [Thermofilum pendens]|uniref:Uncharacterized protein n=1 Tax=Thermofilum pendens (strain DSM 2475 / Hrk 5) TaxID=368408 RepID=A1RW69_THEPD|nr:hypothetical protein [Thermofilum pendens]ABL77449.1 hypothetical protein Tpen_0039 [Thermofilum pendens Hrk 5]
MSSHVTMRGLLVRGVTALAIVLALMYLFSTSLYIPVPVYKGVSVGNIVVAVLSIVFLIKAESLATPLASEVALHLKLQPGRVGGVAKWALRLLSLLVLYGGFFGVAVPVFDVFLEHHVSRVVYDSVFVVAAAVTVYELVKSAVS